jgi:hypothetical protein
MPSPDSALRSLDGVIERLEQDDGPRVRVERADGRTVEGEVVYVSEADLTIRVADGEQVSVPAREVMVLDIESPRRVREWLAAILSIPAVAAILVAFSRIPGVDPRRGDITIGFALVLAVCWGLTRVPGLANAVRVQLTRWDRVYPQPEPWRKA